MESQFPDLLTRLESLESQHWHIQYEVEQIRRTDSGIKGRRVVDLISTGKTLKENGLIEVEKIMDVSSKLIVNRSALKTDTDNIKKIINRFRKNVK